MQYVLGDYKNVILKKIIVLVGVFSTTSQLATGQMDSNKVCWSQSRKLKTDDFSIKLKSLESTTSFSQFYLSFRINGFDFLTKNFNNKVQNCMITTASWIDTTSNVDESLRYQQTLFDISEIYARLFRIVIEEEPKKNHLWSQNSRKIKF